MTKKRCAIVGAAVSGLPSARWALAYDFEPVIFERLDKIGGLWRYKPEQFNPELASVMKSTVIDTSKEMNAYSDFPPPEHFANYMHNTQMLAYLELYTEHHGLYQYIRFHNTVLAIRRAADYSRNGRWNVKWRDENGTEREEEFEAVILAQGHHAKPKIVKFEGQDKFEGDIIHSHDYKNSKEYEDKVNVVVGAGNSAMDLAVELGRVGKKCYLSTRRGAWIGKRVGEGGIPEDCLFNTRFKVCVLNRILPQAFTNWLFIRQCQKRFDHAKYGIMPSHGFFSQHLTVSDDLPCRIITGSVQVKPDIREFTSHGIVWADGTVTDGIDKIVMATGYLFNFDLVENGQLIPVKDNTAWLYKNMLAPQLADWNTLAIVGLAQPSGAIHPVAEMQARLFFAALCGDAKLPTREGMEHDIDRAQAELAKAFVKSTRHTIEVNYILFMDELAELIGCKPNPVDFAFSKPRLAHALLFGPNVSYVYRLRGPKAWDGAEEAILDIPRRMDLCLSGRKVKEAPTTEWAEIRSVLALIVAIMVIGVYLLRALI
ncbi:hypothetical protein niasHS_017881 [Heterodera schachtii]|uniref:Flavin-containing monooxygenase n=2 Tax=Heterodera TaxID=34509 RepID=A0ABD2HYA9_HETSC